MKSKTIQFVVRLLQTCTVSKRLLLQRLQRSFYSQLLKEVENSHLKKPISIDMGKTAETEKVTTAVIRMTEEKDKFISLNIITPTEGSFATCIIH